MSLHRDTLYKFTLVHIVYLVLHQYENNYKKKKKI